MGENTPATKRKSERQEHNTSNKKQKRDWHRHHLSKQHQQKHARDDQSGRTSHAHFADQHGSARQLSSAKKTFSQPSVLQAGDKGIFVTCDKGREKNSLLELLDLVQGYAETNHNALQQSSGSKSNGVPQKAERTSNSAEQVDIELDIEAELAALQHPTTSDASQSLLSNAVDLITLDVPCVSFLRLPRQSALDPVDLVHSLCADALANSARPRSRYVKRLTPVSKLGKALSNGLENACDEVLPQHFHIQDLQNDNGLKYAIRPSIRNNDKIDRDHIIKVVGERVHDLGKGQHKVDLKGYEAGILVEVYRGWIGMSVVGNMNSSKITSSAPRPGYEQLKRFNLAEIYASGRNNEDAG